MNELAQLLAEHGPVFVQALGLTWKLTLMAFVPGVLLGTGVALLRLLPLPPLRAALTLYVEVFRNIPSVALLVFIVFALPDLNVLIDYEPSVVLTLMLVASAFTADYVRTGINTVPGGQAQAALSLGMRPAQVVLAVVLPQALRSVVQPLTSLLIALMLSTSLASQVPMPGRELTALVSKIATDSAAGMAAFGVAAALYVASGLLVAWVGATLDRRLRILR